MKAVLKMMICACLAFGVYNTFFAEEIVYRNYNLTVTSGDTLWDIAARHTEKNEDVRAVVYRIAEANNLHNKNILPGQVIKVPMRVHANDLYYAAK